VRIASADTGSALGGSDSDRSISRAISYERYTSQPPVNGNCAASAGRRKLCHQRSSASRNPAALLACGPDIRPSLLWRNTSPLDIGSTSKRPPTVAGPMGALLSSSPG
jgi:hypothetical protein